MDDKKHPKDNDFIRKDLVQFYFNILIVFILLKGYRPEKLINFEKQAAIDIGLGIFLIILLFNQTYFYIKNFNDVKEAFSSGRGWVFSFYFGFILVILFKTIYDLYL